MDRDSISQGPSVLQNFDIISYSTVAGVPTILSTVAASEVVPYSEDAVVGEPVWLRCIPRYYLPLTPNIFSNSIVLRIGRMINLNIVCP